MILFYIPVSNKKEAAKIATALLKKRLVACCNIFPIRSMYLWQGKMEKANEFVLICKTSKKNAASTEAEVKKLHSYKVPCIIRMAAKANKEFEKYIGSETARIN